MYYGGGNSLSYAGITSDSNTYAALGTYYNTSFLEFDKNNFPVHNSPPSGYDSAVFNAWALSNYVPGSYSFFSTDSTLSVKNGIVIVWTDAVGDQWKTSEGSQAGSYFSIASEEPQYSGVSGYISGIHVTAVFHCTLYNGQGQSMQLVNGRFRLGLWF